MIFIVICIYMFINQIVNGQYWTGSEYYTTNKFEPSLNKNEIRTSFISDGSADWFNNRMYPSLLPLMEYVPTYSGGLSVISGSPNPPIGIAITSENVYGGILTMTGELPFSGVTLVDGMLPSDGVGIINYVCNNDLNTLIALNTSSPPISMRIPEYEIPTGMTTHVSNVVAPSAFASSLNAATLSQPVNAGPAYITPSFSCVERFLDYPYDIEFTATKGGALPVASSSVIPPTGIAVTSDTKYKGILSAAGELPFVGTVKIEGRLPSAGTGTINYVCGNDVYDTNAPGCSKNLQVPDVKFASMDNMSSGYGYYVDYPRKSCAAKNV